MCYPYSINFGSVNYVCKVDLVQLRLVFHMIADNRGSLRKLREFCWPVTQSEAMQMQNKRIFTFIGLIWLLLQFSLHFSSVRLRAHRNEACESTFDQIYRSQKSKRFSTRNARKLLIRSYPEFTFFSEDKLRSLNGKQPSIVAYIWGCYFFKVSSQVW